MVAEIIPAIMPKSLSDLEEGVSQVLGIVSSVQIDLMDGKFVPSVSWPYINKDSVPKSLPNIGEIDFEVDLMVESPADVVSLWVSAGARRLIPHLESLKGPREELLSMRYENVELGIAINTTTPIDRLNELVELVDFVQFMGIERIGYQGEPFDARVINSISSFRYANPDAVISVDGGVSILTAQALIDAGANRLVSGSSIWKSGNIKETVESLRNL